MNFLNRSGQLELLDRPDIPFEDIRRNLLELNFINHYLGGHRTTIKGIKNLNLPKKSLIVCEMGCGGGDNLAVIYAYLKKHKLNSSLSGIDINPYCIEVAKNRFATFPVHFYPTDYRLVNFQNGKPDVLYSSLFCHHFTNQELVEMLRWMQENATEGFFINDLHRHPLAYYSIKLLTFLFSKSYLVKNDAPLSVVRGFRKQEWKQLLKEAGISNYNIEWNWAFRWLITVKSTT